MKAALAEALRNRPTATHTYTPTPTRTPTPRLRAAMLAPTATPTPHLGRAGTLAGGGLAAAVAAPTVTRTPTPSGPLYGARYIPQLAGNLRVNEELTLSVRVSNTSGRAWISGFPGGTFMLSYHWFLGAAPAASPGLKTPLTTAVPPGGSTPELAVRIKAPSTPGTYTLKWDMIEVVNGSEVWFSSKGVPTFDQPINVTK